MTTSGGLAAAFGALSGDLSEAVEDCGCPRVIERARPSAMRKGRVAAPLVERFEVVMSVQPMTDRELQMLPEGMRSRERVKGYACAELKTVDTSDCSVPDRFFWNGAYYQVEKVGAWKELGNFYRYEAVRASSS